MLIPTDLPAPLEAAKSAEVFVYKTNKNENTFSMHLAKYISAFVLVYKFGSSGNCFAVALRICNHFPNMTPANPHNL